MNFNGIDLYINDKRYKDFQSLTKEQQEATKQTIKQLNLLNLSNDITNNIDNILNEKNRNIVNHYQKNNKKQ
jgi:hypothetical protein